MSIVDRPLSAAHSRSCGGRDRFATAKRLACFRVCPVLPCLGDFLEAMHQGLERFSNGNRSAVMRAMLRCVAVNHNLLIRERRMNGHVMGSGLLRATPWRLHDHAAPLNPVVETVELMDIVFDPIADPKGGPHIAKDNFERGIHCRTVSR
jgi:hypothetical protein